MYDEVYKKYVVSMEITKPSEQAFKALYDYEMIGGSLLLFSNPVGRQESDNIDFLTRHGLIFNERATTKLWKYAESGISISGAEKENLFSYEKYVRGIKLPFGSRKAANFIVWCLNNGIFERMVTKNSMKSGEKALEIHSDGVALFWNKVSSLV
jgi:hypothetical protein